MNVAMIMKETCGSIVYNAPSKEVSEVASNIMSPEGSKRFDDLD
jgi:hypothetical protein